MASVSLSFSQLVPQVKAVHTGIIAAGGALSTSAGLTTICPSTVLNFCQVPNRATLLDFWIRIQTGGASQTLQIGTSQTPSGIMSVTTLSQTYSISTQSAAPAPYGVFNQGYIRAPGGTTGAVTGVTDLMPVRISISDDVSPASVWLQGRVGAGCSASAFFTFMVFYTMDGLTGHTTIR